MRLPMIFRRYFAAATESGVGRLEIARTAVAAATRQLPVTDPRPTGRGPVTLGPSPGSRTNQRQTAHPRANPLPPQVAFDHHRPAGRRVALTPGRKSPSRDRTGDAAATPHAPPAVIHTAASIHIPNHLVDTTHRADQHQHESPRRGIAGIRRPCRSWRAGWVGVPGASAPGGPPAPTAMISWQSATSSPTTSSASHPRPAR